MAVNVLLTHTNKTTSSSSGFAFACISHIFDMHAITMEHVINFHGTPKYIDFGEAVQVLRHPLHSNADFICIGKMLPALFECTQRIYSFVNEVQYFYFLHTQQESMVSISGNVFIDISAFSD